MYVKKIIGFCQLLKKMHIKENSFFQPHGVYNSRAHQRGQTSANERYTSGVLSEMTRDVGGDASCQRQRQHQKPNEPHANHTCYVRLHTQTHTGVVCLSVCLSQTSCQSHTLCTPTHRHTHTQTHTLAWSVCLSVTNVTTITHVMYTYTQTHTLAQSVCLSVTNLMTITHVMYTYSQTHTLAWSVCLSQTKQQSHTLCTRKFVHNTNNTC